MTGVAPRFITIIVLIVTAAALPAAEVTLPPYQRLELDNGTVILLGEKRDVPLIGLYAVLRGGAVADPEGLNGVASLFAALLEKGAGERDAAAFAETVESVGGRLSATGGLETIAISGDFLADQADLMVELLADMLRRPTLDPTEMEKLRDRRINFIRAAKDSNLNALVSIYGDALLFGDHPYGNPVSGSEATLANIDIAHIREYYDSHVGADRLVIAVSGDFDAASMTEMLARAFADWRPAAGVAPTVSAPTPASGRRVLLVDKPGATQTYFWLANVGVALRYPQRAELNIANTAFGGPIMSSLLNTELRMKSGLTYGASSSFSRNLEPGSFAISSFTRTEATAEAIDMALALLGQLRATGLDAETIKVTGNYILGQLPTILETAPQLARLIARLEVFGLDASYINDYGPAIAAASVEGVTAVIADAYPAPDDLVFVLLGDAERVRDAIAKYGPVTEISIAEPYFRLPPDEGDSEEPADSTN